MSTPTPAGPPAPAPMHHSDPAYSVAAQHWVHAEQTRWLILYDFLMANSILILAWATLFAGSGDLTVRKPFLFLLSIAGFILSLLWVGLSHRASGFVDMYGHLGLSAEELNPAIIGPFTRGNAYRLGLGSLLTSRKVLIVIPTIFAVVYLSFIVLTCRVP